MFYHLNNRFILNQTSDRRAITGKVFVNCQTSLSILTGKSGFSKFLVLGRRGQVAKAVDCKSTIVGSNPTGAS